jgi:hypothetical protein
MSEPVSAEKCDAEAERWFIRYQAACRERDLYAAQAKLNAQTVIRQANEIRRLESDIARLMRDHEDVTEKFGL